MTAEIPVRLIGGDVIVAGLLVEMNFSSGTQRVWNGFRVLVSGGRTWQPVANFGVVSQVETGDALESPGLTVGLRLPAPETAEDADAFDQFAEAVRDARAENVFRRRIAIYVQMFDPKTQLPDGPPRAVWTGVMVQVQDQWDGTAGAEVSLQCEHVMSAAMAGADGWFTPEDQRARFPGDAGLDFVATIPRRVVKWPRD